MNSKPILCLNFDGVCHQYRSPWTNAWTISDGYVSGLFEFLVEADQYFSIVVYSSRSADPRGRQAMRKWFEDSYAAWVCDDKANIRNRLSIEFVCEKPAAFLTLDDRAITFQGKFPSMDELRNFTPWNKR